MRISDWSSDVCSSDLNKLLHSCRATAPKDNEAHDPSRAPDQHSQFSGVPHRAAKRGIIAICHDAGVGLASLQHCTRKHEPFRRGGAAWLHRSEEHTSELQSLMRISYAVFCLKNKKKQQ